MRSKHFFWYLFSLFILSSCAKRTAEGPSEAVNRLANKEDKARIEQAQFLHDSGDVEAALSSLRTWVDTTIYRPSHDIAYELIVGWLLQLNREVEAKRLASFFLQRHPKSESAGRIIKLFDAKEPNKNIEPPSDETIKEEPPEEESAPIEENAEQFNELLNLENGVPTSQKLPEGPIKELADYVLFNASIDEVRKMAESVNSKGFGYAVVRMAEYYLHLGQPEESLAILSRVKKKLPDEENALVIAMKQDIDNILQVNTKHVGILLPLSGSYAPFGKKTLASISIALALPLNFVGDIGSFNKDGVKFFIADSKSDPTHAVMMVDALVKKHHVALIVGEITNDIGLLSAQICQRYGVPMLSLSRHPSIADVGDNIFVFNSSPQQQIKKLVEDATQKLNHKRFAIMFPRHNYGMSMSKLFFDEVLKNGGSITAIEAYDAHSTDFLDPIKKLVGKYYLNDRPEYAECRGKPDKKSVEECRLAIAPIVDFDALFLPEFQKLALIIPALVQEDLLITNNERVKTTMTLATKRENIPFVRLLGANSWNDQAILTKIAQHISGAYFVDSMSFDNSDELRKFSDNFFSVNASLPTPLEVFAHDAVRFAIALLSYDTHDLSTRKQIRDRILSQTFKGALLDKIAFLKNRELDAQELGFEIVNGNIKKAFDSNNS